MVSERVQYALHVGVLILAIGCALFVMIAFVRKSNERNAKLVEEFQALTNRYKSMQNDRDSLTGRIKRLEETVIRRNEQIKQLKEKE